MKCLSLLVGVILCFNASLAALPQVTSVSPYFGDVAGGSTITISGNDLAGVTEVLFGGTSATVLTASENQVTVTNPAHSPQTVHVTVKDISGFSSATPSDYFVYQGPSLLYAGLEDGSQVAVVDVETLALAPFITVGEFPGALFLTSDGTTVYTINDVSYTDPGSVSVIDTATETVTATITVGIEPFAGCLTPDDKRLYVGNYVDNTVSVIDTSTNTVVATVPVGSGPILLSATPDGARVLVTNYSDNTVSVINNAANVGSISVIATIPVGINPAAVAITPDSLRALVGNSGESSISVIDLRNLVVISTITVGTNPFGIAITPTATATSGLALIGNDSSSDVSFIDLSTLTVVSTVSVGAGPGVVVLTPDGSQAVVSSVDGNEVSIIDVATRVVTATIPVFEPEGISITADAQFAFVTSEPDINPGTMSRIDLTTGTLDGQTDPFESGVSIIAPDQAPLARFSVSVDGAFAFFDASESLSPIGTIVSYIWDFGDSTTATTTSPRINHLYQRARTYTVTLTVVNSNGTSTMRVYNYQSSLVENYDESMGSSLFRNGGPSAQVTEDVTIELPKICCLRPNSGEEGTVVTIRGKGLSQTTQVMFGDKKATILSISADTVTVSAPKGKKGKTVYVTVTTPVGTSKKSRCSRFTYE